MMTVETDEGKAIADAIVILHYCLHRMSVEGTGRFKWTPEDHRNPQEFIRSAVTGLLERFREVLKTPLTHMYVQDRGASDKTLKKNA